MDWKLLLRKHMFSIVCGVIALVAIIALVFPLSGWFTALEKDLESRKQTYNQINTLLNAERFEPSIDPNVKNRLEGFPVPSLIEQGKKITVRWKETAQTFLSNAVKIEVEGMLIPLVAEALPAGREPDVSARNRFRGLYRDRLNVVEGVGTGGQGGFAGAAGSGALTLARLPENSIYRAELHGTFPPTAEEIHQAQTEQAGLKQAEVAQLVNGQVINKDEVDKAVKDAVNIVADKLRYDHARTGLVYADPGVFQPVPAPALATTTSHDQPNAYEIFNAQVTLWIQQDIARAVRDVNLKNNASQSVLNSRIKRLLSCQIKSSYQLPGATAVPGAAPAAPAAPAPTPESGAAAPDMASDITSAASAPIPFDYRNNPLGHASNPLYDVFKFQIVFLVEVDSLSDVLTELSANRYLLVRNVSKISAVDPTRAAAEGFIYGKKPMVQVTLDGQYLLFRPVLVHKYMPAQIKANPVVITAGDDTSTVPGSMGMPGMGMPGEMGMPGGGFPLPPGGP